MSLGRLFLHLLLLDFGDVVPENLIFTLRSLLDVVVHLVEYLKDEVEGFLVDALDGDIGDLLDVLHGGDLLLVETVLLSSLMKTGIKSIQKLKSDEEDLRST